MAAGSEIEHLIKMANQIAENFAFSGDGDKQVASVVDHLTRFWAPAMKQHLHDYVEQGGEGISACVLSALEQLK